MQDTVHGFWTLYRSLQWSNSTLQRQNAAFQQPLRKLSKPIQLHFRYLVVQSRNWYCYYLHLELFLLFLDKNIRKIKLYGSEVGLLVDCSTIKLRSVQKYLLDRLGNSFRKAVTSERRNKKHYCFFFIIKVKVRLSVFVKLFKDFIVT